MVTPHHAAAPTLEPGATLPDTILIGSPGSQETRIPTHSRDALIVLLVPATVEEWIPYLASIEEVAGEIEQWYARLVVVVAGDAAAAEALGDRLPRLWTAAEAEPLLRDRCGVTPDETALLVVDRYGQLYHTATGARADQLPAAGELEEWARFLATQCPECGVIDEPGYGEWALT